MSLDKIEHIVVLMLENRSFDHMLGAMSLNGRNDVEGLKPGMTNPDDANVEQPIQAITNESFLTDPGHRFKDVTEQLGEGKIVNQQLGRYNRGFIQNYVRQFQNPSNGKKYAPEIMHYQTPATVPISFRLAEEYAICDQWFSSVPSETWPNRIFANAATSQGKLTNRLRLYDVRTVFSRLKGGPREWCVYNDQIPNVVNLKELAGEWLRKRHQKGSRFPSMATFFKDCASGSLPKYSWLEPIYFEKVFGMPLATPDDDHPPHDIREGQRLIAEVYRAVRRSPLWTKTLIVILTDEHGGFFDHVKPFESAPAPDDSAGDFGFKFNQLGARVPCIVISPLISKAKVIRGADGTFFDHTSLIATVCRRWKLAPLTRRDKAANDLSGALDLEIPRTDDDETLAFVEAWLESQKAKILGIEPEAKILGVEPETAQSSSMIGLNGRQVAERFQLEPEPEVAKILGGELVPDSEIDLENPDFETSMRALARGLTEQADELEAMPSI